MPDQYAETILSDDEHDPNAPDSVEPDPVQPDFVEPKDGEAFEPGPVDPSVVEAVLHETCEFFGIDPKPRVSDVVLSMMECVGVCGRSCPAVAWRRRVGRAACGFIVSVGGPTRTVSIDWKRNPPVVHVSSPSYRPSLVTSLPETSPSYVSSQMWVLR